jgi:hypothetical protein
MKHIKIYQKFITERVFNTDSIIDRVNKMALDKKISSGVNLTLADVIPDYDLYCGNHTNTDNDKKYVVTTMVKKEKQKIR